MSDQRYNLRGVSACLLYTSVNLYKNGLILTQDTHFTAERPYLIYDLSLIHIFNAYWLVTIVFFALTFVMGDSSLYKRYT